jgi:hypothetical protein
MKLIIYLSVFVNLSFLVVSCSKKDCVKPKVPPINYSDSLKSGLWAHYLLNGNLNDSSGNGRHMRGVNNIELTADKSGITNSALNFDGINDYAVIDDGINFPEGDFTFSFLLYAEKTTGGRIFNKANFNDAKGASIVFGFNDDFADNKLSFGIRNDAAVCNSFSDISNSAVLFPNQVIAQNNWYNVAVQFEKGVQKVYINGQLISAQKTSYLAAKNCNTAPIYFGIWWLQDMRALKGKLDNIRIHTRALSDNEIKYLNDIF